MSKLGRNDPCFCGSGKKYKQCHMRADQAQEREQFMRTDAARFLRLDLPRFAREERFEAAFDAALPIYWNNYYDAENDYEMSQFEALRFLDWLVFDYTLEDGDRIVDLYHAEQSDSLTELQRTLLEAWMEADAAWAYELLAYDGQLLQLRDFMSEDAFEVFEAGGHGNAEVGDVLLARIVPVFEQLEFTTYAAFLSADEIADLADKLEAAKEADTAEYPDAARQEFMRRCGTVPVHHALEQAKLAGRPPVARLDPNRTDPPIEQRSGHKKERVHRQRNYGATQPHMAQTRRKAI